MEEAQDPVRAATASAERPPGARAGGVKPSPPNP